MIVKSRQKPSLMTVIRVGMMVPVPSTPTISEKKDGSRKLQNVLRLWHEFTALKKEMEGFFLLPRFTNPQSTSPPHSPKTPHTPP
jgi:hypothetical protein